jgi:hypothetical protein
MISRTWKEKDAIGGIFVDFGEEMPTASFEVWIKQAKWVKEHKGEYFRN